MSFIPTPPFVPNDPQDLAKNLRFLDRNGNTVTRQFPWNYIETIGGDLSEQIDVVNTVINNLNTANTNITNLQAQVSEILTSGATAIPAVSSLCLSSGTNMPMNTVVDLLVANSCAYNAALGTTTGLYLGVAAQGSNLNTAPAFSQSSAMAGIAGWISTYRTVGDTLNNLWLTALDTRVGVTNALAAITPSCSTIIVDYAVTYDTTAGFNFWFDGYSFYPTGTVDAGSSIQIVDAAGNIYLQAFNIVTASTTTGPINVLTSGTPLLTTSTYTTTVTSRVSLTTPPVGCSKTVIKTVSAAGSGGDTSTCCPDIGTFTFSVTSGSTTIGVPIIITAALTYTPRYLAIEPVDEDTTGYISIQPHYITLMFGGGTVTYNNGFAVWRVTKTANYRWIAYR